MGKSGVALFMVFALTACSSSFHGSYAPISYVGGGAIEGSEPLGKVEGSSCQTKFLYVLPMGDGVSTSEAVRAAKNAREGARYLADIAIDDRTNWQFGYLEQCITVEAIAY
ncbi:hypothetical protein LPB19_00445 [Marinobacter salinisoli]|uniref:TRL-like family protein n=1 Tax=Marinobacter salinisoli TaxID=2769486 RepID=A0ABX7MV21_9GAMM|nr:hypothetical protein [Marinobacter salinisoli]QSP94931.1 hypothetical protein LPB19_00445 [Marinobacter salinisoli]